VLDARDASARVVRVVAPADERLLRIDLHEGSRFRGGTRVLVAELHTNQWNALLVDASDRRIVSVLRAREAGARILRAGEVYAPPAPQRRLAAQPVAIEAARDEWMARLASVPPAERRGEMLRHFAWTSPINAAWVLGDAASDSGDGADPGDAERALEAAFDRWWHVATRTDAAPVLMETKAGPQPYPFALDGVPSTPFPSLLAAMEAAASAAEAGEAARDRTGMLERVLRKRDSVRQRLARLAEERAKIGQADRLRLRGDLLLSNLARVQSGASRVTVFDEEGRKIRIAIDPALRPHENAERWYEEARRRSRAEERIPELAERAEKELARWEEAARALETGAEPPAWLDAAVRRAEAREPKQQKAPQGERMPFRAYRTSGGLEVRVGRGSKDNDQLTFRHASPEDVWLHARSVPGSHVVLRWSGEGAPPARDLEEAATLAALYSKARSSGTVAVDWTRRKYVRKPRGAPPGRVSILQAKTIFVEPDPALEERLREG
jgi:predicted ribosome quality control (RQC) complex YloA/Tae2 family protein